MTFDSRERSLATGQPIRLYLFSRGALSWAYCGADRTVNFQGRVYAPLPISDDGVRMTGETSADVLTITAPASLDVAQLYRYAPPSAEIELAVRDYHFGEVDAASSARFAWMGSVSGVRWPQVDRCQIACESISASMNRPGLRLTWERTCPHTIFDRNCRLDRNVWAVNATLLSLTALSIESATFAAKPDGYFAGGYVEWAVGAGEMERRGVESHAGSTLGLLNGTQGMVTGQPVVAYPGCRQTNTYCNGTFNNLVNFGGIAHMPGKSPFDGDPIF